MKYRDMEHRLMANSYVCEETGCWIWTGREDDKGYGRITIRVDRPVTKRIPKNKRVTFKKVPVAFPVHRVAYQILMSVTLDPDSQTIDHDCPCGPRKLCINPDHMRVVSRSVNTKLMWARKRVAERGEEVRF